MSTNEERVLHYLREIFPNGQTNSEICEATKIEPHQQVFQLTQKLKNKEMIRGERRNGSTGKWVFFAKESRTLNEVLPAQMHAPELNHGGNVMDRDPLRMTPHQFEIIAKRRMSEKYQERLSPRETPGVPKKFDLVSDDYSIIGDVKYYTLVRGRGLPPAKFATIAEYVWLLGKTQAKIKFLVFGNDIRVPKMWLEKYGTLVTDVDFYFLSMDGRLTLLH